ncbi:unnamed protein product [Cyprideis torosa]|uniref:Uncharacterized protein n=1 Tax=Cyprideis torosa TaxID=163714 RepID=A0A7R8ZQR6_9CRUS|nr:unnamed protein product [Cyprideis torosa]CAG0897028.1 unnamed protein product [Cyprideis torosa]
MLLQSPGNPKSLLTDTALHTCESLAYKMDKRYPNSYEAWSCTMGDSGSFRTLLAFGGSSFISIGIDRKYRIWLASTNCDALEMQKLEMELSALKTSMLQKKTNETLNYENNLQFPSGGGSKLQSGIENDTAVEAKSEKDCCGKVVELQEKTAAVQRVLATAKRALKAHKKRSKEANAIKALLEVKEREVERKKVELFLARAELDNCNLNVEFFKTDPASTKVELSYVPCC